MRKLLVSLVAGATLLMTPTAHASRREGHRERHHREYREDSRYGCGGCYSDYRDDRREYREDYDYDEYQGRDDDGGYSYERRRQHNGNEGDCQGGGCGNRSRRCENSSGDCRSSFSPGPFKDSPVTIIVCPPGTQSCGSNQPPSKDGDRPSR